MKHTSMKPEELFESLTDEEKSELRNLYQDVSWQGGRSKKPPTLRTEADEKRIARAQQKRNRKERK